MYVAALVDGDMTHCVPGVRTDHGTRFRYPHRARTIRKRRNRARRLAEYRCKQGRSTNPARRNSPTGRVSAVGGQPNVSAGFAGEGSGFNA